MKPADIFITPHIAISEDEIEETFIRASGPGGQNVNKVATAVQLRFDLRNAPTLPADVKARAERLAGARLTRDGVIVLTADRFRTQAQNRDDARARLIDLLQRAAHRPKPRKPTRPTKAARKKRVDQKKQRGAIKALRQRRPETD